MYHISQAAESGFDIADELTKHNLVKLAAFTQYKLLLNKTKISEPLRKVFILKASVPILFM